MTADNPELSIEALLSRAIDMDASDLHIKAGSPPLLRIHGQLMPLKMPKLTAAQSQALSMSILNESQAEEFRKKLELDLAKNVQDLTRFRANLLMQRGTVSAVLRLVPASLPSFDQLKLPPILKELAMRPRGLILVTGPAGSGKSTTQAALIEYINQNAPINIITIEDPIEYLHSDSKAIVSQREIGRDTPSFASALKYALRQDPDVILIGEMRSLETIALAVTAAETGHLVFGTLHTPDAVRAIDRVIDAFPSFQQSQIRIQLANNLVGVASQRLITRYDTPGIASCFEILVATPAIKGLIRESKSHQIRSHIQSGGKFGMQTMDQDLLRLIREGMVDRDTAFATSQHPDDLRRLLASAVQSV